MIRARRSCYRIQRLRPGRNARGGLAWDSRRRRVAGLRTTGTGTEKTEDVGVGAGTENENVTGTTEDVGAGAETETETETADGSAAAAAAAANQGIEAHGAQNKNTEAIAEGFLGLDVRKLPLPVPLQ